uniref:BRI3 binding protein n=1 Tax=Anolis carolinensis TaxID=28377 RepID=H9GLA8_ANOCA
IHIHISIIIIILFLYKHSPRTTGISCLHLTSFDLRLRTQIILPLSVAIGVTFLNSFFLTLLFQFFSRLTERFVYGVDVLVDTFWRIWADLLDVLGIDGSNVVHYFSPGSLANNPTRALLLIGAVLLAYWFVSLLLGFFFYLLHVLCGRFFWIVRVALFALSCVYILQKYEGEPELAVLPLCFVVAVYFMTGPVGFYWRRNSHSTLEEKIDHLDSQIRLLNIRLSRVIENLDRGSDQ